MNVADHLARMKAAVYASYNLEQIPKWVKEKTFLHGRPYSFKDHEFQEVVLSDTSTEVNCQKCSQIGMTEAQGRWGLGVCHVFPGFSVIYTMPYSGDASLLARTRIDPIITTSPELTAAMNRDLNNTEVKQILMSFMYFRGTSGNTQALSIPADCIISDEIDKSNTHILSQYTSRLTHSKWKLRRNFSTPTVDGYGIALKMETSRRFRNLCKCNHCGNEFVPNYYEHVKIPEYDDSLEVVTKSLLQRIRWKDAQLHCPKCGNVPSLQLEHRRWVQENSLERHDAAGYYISPFDAPNVITIPTLIKASTEYAKISEFKNQNLGLTATDTEETLTLDDLRKARRQMNLADSGLYAMGADMGLVCRIVIGRIDQSGILVVVHREKVPLGEFEHRARELANKYRCIMKVFDSLPYVDLIMRMQKRDTNLYASVFVTSKNVEVYKIYEKKEDKEAGQLDVRQVKVNRNKALDELVGHIKKNGLAVQADPNEDDDFDSECLDLKRVMKVDNDGEMGYSWEKSATGTDHYFFALLYLYVAARLRGLASNSVAWDPAGIVGSFRVAESRRL